MAITDGFFFSSIGLKAITDNFFPAAIIDGVNCPITHTEGQAITYRFYNLTVQRRQL